jgi:hypothetical protein
MSGATHPECYDGIQVLMLIHHVGVPCVDPVRGRKHAGRVVVGVAVKHGVVRQLSELNRQLDIGVSSQDPVRQPWSPKE